MCGGGGGGGGSVGMLTLISGVNCHDFEAYKQVQYAYSCIIKG